VRHQPDVVPPAAAVPAVHGPAHAARARQPRLPSPELRRGAAASNPDRLSVEGACCQLLRTDANSGRLLPLPLLVVPSPPPPTNTRPANIHAHTHDTHHADTHTMHRHSPVREVRLDPVVGLQQHIGDAVHPQPVDAVPQVAWAVRYPPRLRRGRCGMGGGEERGGGAVRSKCVDRCGPPPPYTPTHAYTHTSFSHPHDLTHTHTPDRFDVAGGEDRHVEKVCRGGARKG
jgi:hypothetical protein